MASFDISTQESPSSMDRFEHLCGIWRVKLRFGYLKGFLRVRLLWGRLTPLESIYFLYTNFNMKFVIRFLKGFKGAPLLYFSPAVSEVAH